MYNDDPKDDIEVGLDNTYVLKNESIFNNYTFFNNVSFLFSDTDYDNVICDNQQIYINQKVDKLHLIAFSYWGSTNAFFKVIFEDDSIELIKIPFIDWVQKAKVNYETISWYGEGISTIKQIETHGSLKTTVNFHHTVTEINTKKLIKEIIFPDNFLLHIFALTLEKTE